MKANYSLVVKDFFWWLLKNNRLVNACYIHLGKRFFPSLDQTQNLKGDTTVKSDYRHATPQSWPYIKGYTSGTTNQPLTVYRSLKSILLEEYVIKTAWHHLGVSYSPRIAILRGDHVAHSDSKQGFWQQLPFTKRLLLSSYHLGPETARLYLDKLNEYKPEVLMAYPSSIYLLAKLADKINWKVNWPLRCVFTSSETFSKSKQELVKKVFGTVCDHYGQAERVAVLQSCSQGHYHVRQDYSLIEFIPDEHGNKIIGTNVHNKAMPMHRYDTGDYVTGINHSGNCPCGDNSIYVEEILGRDDDYVILSDGRQIGRLDVAFKGVEGLIEAQLEQSSKTKIIIRYVAYSDANVHSLKATMTENLHERLGSNMELNFIQLDSIPRTERGKFKSVIRNPNLD